MKRLYILAFMPLLVWSCNEKGTRVDPRQVQANDTPPAPTPTPTPDPPAPTPTPDPTPIPSDTPAPPDTTPDPPAPIPDPDPSIFDVFFKEAHGQWLGTCVANKEKGTSILPGFKFDRREYLWIEYRYVTPDCRGPSDPVDGFLVYWLIEKVEPAADGWFTFSAACNSPWNCAGKKQTVKVLYKDRTLSVQESAAPVATLLTNGPAQ